VWQELRVAIDDLLSARTLAHLLKLQPAHAPLVQLGKPPAPPSV
jgi:hypothetical protein